MKYNVISAADLLIRSIFGSEISLTLNGIESTSIFSEAYKVFREIIQSYGGDDAKWDEALLDSARGSQVRDWD